MRIAAIPDTHFPFEDEIKLHNCITLISQLSPDAIIQVGDLRDQLSFSKYARNPSKMKFSPSEESTLARTKSCQMWEKIKKLNKKSKLFQMSGNHDERLSRKLQDKFPEAAFIGEQWTKAQMSFPGVETVEDEFILDNIMFMHGMRKAGEHAKYNQMNTITGHTHKGRIEYFANRHGPYWEMNCGWLGDKEAYPFSYKLQKVIDDTHHGFGFIENGQPRFITV